MLGTVAIPAEPVGVFNLRPNEAHSGSVSYEAVEVLLTGPPGSEVELKLLSEDGNSKVVQLQRVALYLAPVSWARAVLPLRIRRLELEKPSKELTEDKCTERDALTEGEV